LIEAVFKRPTQDRVLPFSVISKEAQVPIDEVEHLVMKALAYVLSFPLSLSLFLVEAVVDEVMFENVD